MSKYAAKQRLEIVTGRESGAKQRRRPVSFLHISATLVHEIDEQTGLRHVLVAKGKTYRRPK